MHAAFICTIIITFGAAVYFAVDFWAVDARLRWISKMLRWICARFAVF